MRSAALTFAVGVAVLAGVGALTLSRAPLRLVRTGVPGVAAVGPTGIVGLVASTSGGATLCQAGEYLPAKVSAIRLAIWGFYGARVRVVAFKGGRVLTEGRRGANWTSDSVTVPVKPLAHAVAGVRTCVVIGPNSETMLLLGPPTSPSIAALGAEHAPLARISPKNAQPLRGRLVLEYLAPSRSSWWSRLLSVARHLGLGRFYAGSWITLLIAALMAVVAALAVRLTMRELR